MSKANQFLDSIFETECDSAVITNRENVRYLSGFTGSAGYIIMCRNEKLLITDFRYIEQATSQARNFEIRDIADFNIGEYAKKFSCTAFEDETVSYKEYLKLKENFKSLKSLGNMLLKMRSVKTEEEIKLIAKAEKIGDKAFSHALSLIKTGMSELELAREIDFFMLSHGAERLSFDTIVASGNRGSMPHAVPTDNTLKNGDLVVMDFGCMVDGYCGDMTRTIGIGNVSDDLKEAYETVLKAQIAALDMIKAEVNCAHVHNTAFNIIDEKYKGMFGHALGHGTGLQIHELPTFSKGSDYPLPESSVISVEPGVYIPGKCGVRIEDLVLVTKDGYKNLTSSPKDLIII